MHDHVGVEEANRMYWETDASVADIATRLDLSRRGLYDAIRPQPAGFACAQCGASLHFENRSARRHGTAECASCGAKRTIPAEPNGPAQPVVRADARTDARALLRDPDVRHRAVMLGSAAIAGVAIGTVAALIAMRRD